MSVVIETTLGDITVDLYLEQRPVTCLNFLKLCKMKYYNFNLFHSIRSGFIAQTGDPTAEGSGGESIFGVLEGPDKRFFSGEKLPKVRHTNTGTLSMVCTGDMMVGSQFFFTLAPDLDSLDGVHCVIGEVTEGHDVLRKLNDVICDETHRPYRDVRITHTVVLEDPFNDPPGLRAPSRSPSPSAERLKGGRIAPDEDIDEAQGKSAEEVQEMIEEKEAKARATILEIVGDLPDADVAPPENVLFVCKLNPVTTDEDLEIIFSRFGKIIGCEVIRDKKTGDSLQYAFIEFSDKKSCEDAYFKMDNVLIDDRRIHVDFSQSVSRMRWMGKGRGVKYFNENESKDVTLNNNHSSNQHIDDQEKTNHKNGKIDDDSKRRHASKDRDHDKDKSDRESRRDRSERSSRHKKSDRDRSRRDRSRSRSRRGKSRHRSKRDRSRSRSRSRKEKSSHRSRRDRSRSRDRSRRERSKSRDRSRRKRSRSRSRDRSRRHRNRSRSRDRSRRDRSRSRSRARKSRSRSRHRRDRSRSSTRKDRSRKEKSRSHKDRSLSKPKTDKLNDSTSKTQTDVNNGTATISTSVLEPTVEAPKRTKKSRFRSRSKSLTNETVGCIVNSNIGSLENKIEISGSIDKPLLNNSQANNLNEQPQVHSIYKNFTSKTFLLVQDTKPIIQNPISYSGNNCNQKEENKMSDKENEKDIEKEKEIHAVEEAKTLQPEIEDKTDKAKEKEEQTDAVQEEISSQPQIEEKAKKKEKKPNPSAVEVRKKEKSSKKNNKNKTHTKTLKKKRKHTSSTSESSSESSTSSESSSSSDDNRKKKSLKRRKKKVSTSSSSSSSTSSSSSSSSDSSSSSSDSEPKKKKRKKNTSKVVKTKRTKKKL